MFSEKAKKKFLFYRFITHRGVFCPVIPALERLPTSFCLPWRRWEPPLHESDPPAGMADDKT